MLGRQLILTSKETPCKMNEHSFIYFGIQAGGGPLVLITKTTNTILFSMPPLKCLRAMATPSLRFPK